MQSNYALCAFPFARFFFFLPFFLWFDSLVDSNLIEGDWTIEIRAAKGRKNSSRMKKRTESLITRKREENIIRLEMAVRIFGGKLKGLFLGGLAGRLQQKRAGKRWLSAGPCRRIRLVCMPIRYRVLVTPARRHSQAEYAVSHGNFRQFAKRSDARLRAVPRSCKPRRNTFSKRAASPGSLYITTVEEYFK